MATMLLTFSLAATGYFAWQLWGTDLYTKYQQARMSGVLAARLAGYTPPGSSPAVVHGTGPAPTVAAARPKPVHVVNMPDALAPGQPVGRIKIPRIDLNSIFVMGTNTSSLKLGPGLWEWGAMPGMPGNATISGHRTTYGHPYRHLEKLQVGDKIIITTPKTGKTVYEVRGTTISSPFDVAVTGPTPGVRLTLTTCNPVGSARQRLVVEAEAVSGKYAHFAVPATDWKLLTA